MFRKKTNKKEMINMIKAKNYTPTEQKIKEHIHKHHKVINELIALYDSDYKAKLRKQKKLYKDYILINKINYDLVRDSAYSLEAYTKAIYDQITFNTYIIYLDRFYTVMKQEIDTILSNNKVTISALFVAYYIRNIYNFYKGTHQELLLLQAINNTSLTASYNPTLDKTYGVDLTINDSYQSLAIQLKSSSNLYTNYRMSQTEQKLLKYKSETSNNYYYMFYDSKTNSTIKQKLTEGTNKYLFTYEEVQNIQESNKANITTCETKEATDFLSTYFFIHNPNTWNR